MLHNTSQVTWNITLKLFAKGKSIDDIQNHLNQTNHAPEKIAEAILHVKNLRNEKERRVGFTLIAVGALLCITGFIIVVLTSSESITFNVALYGVTGIGATSIIGGLFTLLG